MSEEFIDDIIADMPAEETVPAGVETTPVDDTSVPGDPSLIMDPSQEDTTLPAASPTLAVPTDETAEPSEVSVNSLAEQLGWNPSHTGETYVDAAEYILKSKNIQDSMRDHNRELKTQLVDMKDSIAALQSHNEHVYKTEVTRLQGELTALNEQKKDAIELGDVAKVNSIDEQIDSVKQNISTPEPKPSAPSSNPVYDDWVKDNNWYLTSPDMATYADQVAQQYQGAPADRVYNIVRQKVAEVWPEKFEASEIAPAPTLAEAKPTPTIAPVSPVEATTPNAVKQSFTETDLTSDQKSIMSQFVRQGIMTKDQYISDIAKLQEA